MIFILGPCVIESEEHAVRMARTIRGICARLGQDFIFKASFDKANRTSLDGYRGPGLERGLEILAKVKREVGCRITTDIHESWHAGLAAEVVDIIQIPALLCRQTDLLVAAGRTGRTVNIKKGQFIAPEDMAHAAEKARRSGAAEVWLTERGTTFGYHNLVVDMRSIPTMKRTGCPVIMDATHAVQKPSGGAGCSTGEPEFIPVLAGAAVAAGVDGVFLEVHDDPAHALSDGPNSLRLDALEGVLRRLLRIEEALCDS
jgi:2-dehydro-3-deoxyphosphooctonate aldolase (KDO 8-P synthase)